MIEQHYYCWYNPKIYSQGKHYIDDLFEKFEILRNLDINNLWNFLCIKILNYCICMRAWNNRKKEKKVIDAEQDNWDIQFINAIIYFSCQEVFTLQPV